MRQKALLLAAVFFGVLTFMFTYYQLSLERKKIQGSLTTVQVIQAVKALSEGDKLSEDNIRIIKAERASNSLNSSREIPGDRRNAILGAQVLSFIKAGDTIQWTDLKSAESTGRGGLSAKIPQGRRAISISVDSTASVNGLIQPNNHVDLIGTFRFPDMRGDSSYDTITLTILQNVVILATGSDMGYQDNFRNGAPGSRSYSTVTLALSPKEVEMIIFASQKGRIQLSLRNYDDVMVERNVQSVNWKYLQENIQKYNSEREQDMKLRSYGGK